MIDVELIEHKGMKDGVFGPEEISLNQWIVNAKPETERAWKRIGYMTFDGRFAPIVHIHESFKEILRDKLIEASGIEDVTVGVIYDFSEVAN